MKLLPDIVAPGIKPSSKGWEFSRINKYSLSGNFIFFYKGFLYACHLGGGWNSTTLTMLQSLNSARQRKPELPNEYICSVSQ